MENLILATPETSTYRNACYRKIEGLIHISEIDWKLIENPRDFLQAGQIVKAKIINIEGNKVSLSLKVLKPDPWEKIEEKYTVGQTINGDVAKITSYGVLVRLDEEIYGLVSVSEFGEKTERINKDRRQTQCGHCLN